MPLEFATISVIFISSCVCMASFLGVAILYVVSVKRGMKESDRLVKAIERFAHDNKESMPLATRLLVGIYLLISLSAMGSLLFLMVVILAYEAGLPLTDNLNVESLGFISAVILLVLILSTLILRILFGKIFKSR